MKLFVDSGAFSLYTKLFARANTGSGRYSNADYNFTRTKEFSEYLDSYIKFLCENKEYLELYVGLDIIGDPQRSWDIQKYMESFGLSPLPVYHVGEDIKWLKRYVDNYDYIGCGGFAKDISKKAWINSMGNPAFSIICDTPDRLPRVKVHGFAMTSPELMAAFPWFSVDSTSWVMFGKYGAVLVPKSIHGKFIYSLPPWVVFTSNRSPKKKLDNFSHLENLPNIHQRKVLQYFADKKVVLGESKFKTVELGYKPSKEENWSDRKKGIIEIKIEKGISNDHSLRDDLNLQFFLDLEKSLPEWPWPWEPKNRTRRFF